VPNRSGALATPLKINNLVICDRNGILISFLNMSRAFKRYPEDVNDTPDGNVRPAGTKNRQRVREFPVVFPLSGRTIAKAFTTMVIITARMFPA
jgi:hypothetical protein